jgi:hypothetical protein
MLDVPQQARSFIEMLGSLPGEIHLGIDGRGTPAPGCSVEALQQIMKALAAPLPPGQSRWLTLGRRMDRADVVALGSAIREPIVEGLRALLPVYLRIAWTRDNDHIAMRALLEEHKIAGKPHEGGEHPAPDDRYVPARSDQVRITGGVFAGRTGVIQEIDGKGLLKVLVGNIPVKLRADEVEKH